MRIVAVPVGGPDYIQQTALDIARGKSIALLEELTTLEDAQASQQVLHFSAASRLNFLVRALPSALTESAASEFDSLLEQTLGAILEGPSKLGERPTPGPDAVSSPATPQMALAPEAIRQARFSIREGSLGLPSAVDITGPAFIGGQALVLAPAVVATNSPGLSRELLDLAATPHAVALCAEQR